AQATPSSPSSPTGAAATSRNSSTRSSCARRTCPCRSGWTGTRLGSELLFQGPLQPLEELAHTTPEHTREPATRERSPERVRYDRQAIGIAQYEAGRAGLHSRPGDGEHRALPWSSAGSTHLEVPAQETGCLGREPNDLVGRLSIELEVELGLRFAVVPVRMGPELGSSKPSPGEGQIGRASCR